MSINSISRQSLTQHDKFLAKHRSVDSKFWLLCCCDNELGSTYIRRQQYIQYIPYSRKISVKKLVRRPIQQKNQVNLSAYLSRNTNNTFTTFNKMQTESVNTIPKMHQHRKILYENPKMSSKNRINFIYPSVKNSEQRSIQTQNTTNYLVEQVIVNAPTFNFKPKYEIKRQKSLSIEDQINNILELNDNPKQLARPFFKPVGEEFKLSNKDEVSKPQNNRNLVNFSFGQNQKTQFMQKYMTKIKENEEKMLIQSKSHENIFERGTFNKQNLLNLARKISKDQSQSYRSHASSQSFVIQSYQSLKGRKQYSETLTAK